MNPLTLGTEIAQLINSLGPVQVAGIALLFAAGMLVWRRSQSDTDPSFSIVEESDTGALTLNISGAWLVGLLLLAAAISLRGQLMEFPVTVGGPILLLGGLAWWMEKREAN
ncbi:MAG: hypothetical protein U5J98_06960 [Halobacteriales archaeon]|nr:hypothetical protein [Halobacteriales archaeon]